MADDSDFEGVFKILSWDITETSSRHSDGYETDSQGVTQAKNFDGRKENDLEIQQMMAGKLYGQVTPGNIKLRRKFTGNGNDRVATFVGTYSDIVDPQDKGDTAVDTKVVTIMAKKLSDAGETDDGGE